MARRNPTKRYRGRSGLYYEPTKAAYAGAYIDKLVDFIPKDIYDFLLGALADFPGDRLARWHRIKVLLEEHGWDSYIQKVYDHFHAYDLLENPMKKTPRLSKKLSRAKLVQIIEFGYAQPKGSAAYRKASRAASILEDREMSGQTWHASRHEARENPVRSGYVPHAALVGRYSKVSTAYANPRPKARKNAGRYFVKPFQGKFALVQEWYGEQDIIASGTKGAMESRKGKLTGPRSARHNPKGGYVRAKMRAWSKRHR